MNRAVAVLAFCFLAACGAAQAQKPSVVPVAPERPDVAVQYLFYLHGRIVEDLGPAAISQEFGRYEYVAILEQLVAHGFIVISEARQPNTDPVNYADATVRQIQRLLKAGVAPSNITVVGASKGSLIAMLVSTSLPAPIRYVLMANCSERVLDTFPVYLQGDVLSIYEDSDELAQSCRPLFDRSPKLGQRREIRLATGLRHGFIFRPLDEWMRPTVAWARDGA